MLCWRQRANNFIFVTISVNRNDTALTDVQTSMLSLINSLRTPVARLSSLSRSNPGAFSFVRFKSSGQPDKASQTLKNRSTLYYATAAGVLFVGLTYAAVPLYRMFCQVSNVYNDCGRAVVWFLVIAGLQLWWNDWSGSRRRQSGSNGEN